MESALHYRPGDGLKVIETFRLEPGGHAPRLDQHLARMAATCARLGFPFGEAAMRRAIAAVDAPAAQRVRVTVDEAGGVGLTHADLGDGPREWRVVLAAEPVASDDPWLRIKTTRRRLYDQTRAELPEGVDEAIFLNERGEATEGTITNLFAVIDGRMLTPPVACGLLPGILRQELLETGRAREAVLVERDIRQAESLFVGNSLRGLIAARLV